MNPLSYHLNSLHSSTVIPCEFPGFHRDVITDSGFLKCDAALLKRFQVLCKNVSPSPSRVQVACRMEDTLQGTCILDMKATISLETSAAAHVETQCTSK